MDKEERAWGVPHMGSPHSAPDPHRSGPEFSLGSAVCEGDEMGQKAHQEKPQNKRHY